MSKVKQINTIREYITVGLFLLVIFVPNVVWLFCGDAIGKDDSEKRELAEMPEFDFTSVETFPKDFDNYWNDNLPFRKIIRSLWTNGNYRVFHDSTSPSVIIGKSDGGDDRNTWLFYAKNADFNPVKDVQGLSSYSSAIKNKIEKALVDNKKYLAEKDIDFYFFIAPSKENIYREFLPDDVKIYDEYSRVDKIVSEMKDDGSEVIYAKNDLINAKKDGQLYFKQDTHWNELGAMIGFNAIMSKIDSSFELSYSYENVGPVTENKDLTDLLGVKDYFIDYEPRSSYLHDIKPERMKIGQDKNEIVVSTNDNALLNKTVMIVGDSYRTAMLPYFEKTFSKVIGMHRGAYKKEMINEYKPDIVVSEMVERYVVDMGGFKF